MTYKVKKVKNCFRNAETYEYSTKVKNTDLIALFASLGSISHHGEGEARFFVVLSPSRFRIMGLLGERTFRVSFFDSATDNVKTEFERELDKFFGV